MLKQDKTKTETALANIYGAAFYSEHIENALRSALRYADLLASLFKPNSVVDVGCGRGAWLKAFKEAGATRLVGYDGPWNTQQNMIDKSIVFIGVDLDMPITISESERYDLAIALEVAEHLKPSSAQTFVKALTDLSDAVLFGAAYTKQGGINHINEQPHTYWAKIFASFDYVPYDLFRPVFWGDKNIPFWYQQNTFLYVRKNTSVSGILANAGHHPINNISFMDCVHPILYERNTTISALVKQLLVKAIPKPLMPLALRVKRFIA